MPFTKFFNDCDTFLEAWLNNPATMANSSPFFQNSTSFLWSQYKYMPEPFLGNPYDCSAVILNLNPGNAEQDYHCSHSRAQAIVKKGYSQFAKDFSIFPQNAGGYIWWFGRKGNSGRNKWISRFTGSDKKPFAIDLCPWHSKSWGKINFTAAVIKEINDKVLTPAFAAVKNSQLKFVIAIGKSYIDVLKSLGFVDVKTYDKNSQLTSWPVGVNRTYTLLRRDDQYILCTHAPGSNKVPGPRFQQFENYLKADLQKIIP